MIQYIYFVKCPNCEDEHFDFFDAAKEFACGCLSQKPIITQVEVNRNDFGECTDHCDLGTVWSWEDMMTDTEKESSEESSLLTKDFLAKVEPDNDPEFAALDNSVEVEDDDFRFVNTEEDTRKPIPEGMTIEQLIEEMEENEDMVECKECFDLFPKADCVKLEIGYICPHCNCGHDVADEDIFKVDFPEYEKFNEPDDFMDYHSDEAVTPNEEVPVSEPYDSKGEPGTEGEPGITPEEAVPFLVTDEVEAVAGYEKAAEVVEASDLENKEEILDTIEHIKEEEEEHIKELQDLVDTEEDEIVEVENDPISDEAEESEGEELVEKIDVDTTDLVSSGNVEI